MQITLLIILIWSRRNITDEYIYLRWMVMVVMVVVMMVMVEVVVIVVDVLR